MNARIVLPSSLIAGALLALIAVGTADATTLLSGSETELSVPVIGPAEAAQVDPRAAFDGTNFLTVWRDFRAGWPEVWGARVARDGTVLDPAGFRIGAYTDGNLSCDMAFGDGVFLVAWRGRHGQTVGYRLVGTEGAPLDVERSEQTVSPADDGPKVASNDSRFLVLVPAAPAVALIIRRDGSLERRVELTGFNASRSNVAGAGDRFLVASVGSAGTDVWEISNEGALRKLASFAAVEREPQRALLATHGGDWLLAWNEPSYSGIDLLKSPLYLVHATGGVPGSRRTAVADTQAVDDIAMASGDDGSAQIVWGTSPYALPGPRRLQSLVVNSTGQIIGSSVVVDGALEWQAQPAVVSDGSQFAIFWANREGIRRKLGDLTPDGVFPRTAVTQNDAAVVRLPDGSGTLVVWGEPVVGRGRLLDATRSNGGTSAPGEQRVLREWVSPVVHPGAAASDTTVFLGWFEVEQRELATLVLGMRLDAAGAQLDIEPIPISIMSAIDYGMPSHPPAVVWTGSVFVVSWTDSVGRLLIRRFLPSGEPVDAQPNSVAPARVEFGEAAPQLAPAAARDGEVTMLVWQDGVQDASCHTLCPPSGPAAQILGLRLNAMGEPIDSEPRVVSRSMFALRPAIAAGRGRFLVAWTRQISTSSSSRSEGWIAGAFLGRDGAFATDEIVISSASSRQDRASAVTGGDGFVVAWSDGRRERGPDNNQPEMRDIYAAVLGEDGKILASDLRIQADEATQNNPDLVTLGGERILAVYERVVASPPYTGVRRLFTREMIFSEMRQRPVRR